MRFIKYFFICTISCAILGAVSLFGLYKYVEPDLPDVTNLKDIRLQQPLEIYSIDDELIAQYGEMRRIPLTLNQIPPKMLDAILAIEDTRFYSHYGIDPKGTARAIYVAIRNGGRITQGGSTITQQLAKNVYLSSERKIIRKIKESFLAFRMEQQFSKDEILELYLNKIFLGHRAYGVGAAAYVYFGKEVHELTLGEIAIIVGLPKSPSKINPITSPENAKARRNIVLKRMLDLNFITQDEHQQARDEPIISKYHEAKAEFVAPYLASMVYQEMKRQFGENATTSGYKVYTTITKKLQIGATDSLRNNILNYDMRHGYRGPIQTLWLPNEVPLAREKILAELAKQKNTPPLQVAAALSVTQDNATLLLPDGRQISLELQDVKWAIPQGSRSGTKLTSISEAIKPGEMIWIRQSNDRWTLAQYPEINSALVSINPENGAILALVGGFDFTKSEFNRVTQSIRQAGSTIKPFIYTAALDKGMTLATILNDLPITRWDAHGYAQWRPKNSPPRYDGPLRLRVGIGLSKNVMIVRAMRAIGVDYAADYLERFGFTARRIERTESLALGAATVTPLQIARGYAVFANGGYLVDPYFISRIENNNKEVLFAAQPKTVCNDCELPVIYGEIEKSQLLVDRDLEDITYSSQSIPDIEDESQEDQGVVPNIMELPDIQVPLESENVVTSTPIPAPKPIINKESYAPRVISPQLAFLMNDALKTTISSEPGGGWLATGWRSARVLKRTDIAGKTGTTNNIKDTWFAGYGPGAVTAVWLGFDDHRRGLGRGEAGAHSAQPAWNDFMKIALDGIPVQTAAVPERISRVSINMATGNLAPEGGPGTKLEYFIQGTEPTREINIDSDIAVIDENGARQEIW